MKRKNDIRKHTVFFQALLLLLFLMQPRVSQGQTLSPQWAREIDGAKTALGTSGGWVLDMAADKNGNNYALIREKGYITVGGHTTADSNDQLILVSWSCDGHFRWMKAFGGTSLNNKAYLELDTLDGVYVAGTTGFSLYGTTAYWGTDTAIINSQADKIQYIMKYDTSGQFKWFRLPADGSPQSRFISLSVAPAGEIFWFAVLEPGMYDGGTFSVNTRKYYAVQFDALGNYQAVTPLAMSVPALVSQVPPMAWRYDPVMDRFYVAITYSNSFGSMAIGNTGIAAPPNLIITTAVIAAFGKQGNSIWMRQAGVTKSSTIVEPACSGDGRIFLGVNSELGVIFLGDTTTNSLGQNSTAQLMALDTNGHLLWANHAGNTFKGRVESISQVNNTLAAVGAYIGTLAWDNNSINVSYGLWQGYLATVNASTGAVDGLYSIPAGADSEPVASCVDRNGDVYIGGHFWGAILFPNDTFLSSPDINHYDEFIVKYQNVVCNCDLLQPSFTFTQAGGTTYQFNYTGQTPYTAISWDFGDGTPVVPGANPLHSYTTPGNHAVCVTVTNNCGSNTTCQYITPDVPTGQADFNAFGSVTIYPNPAHDQLTVEQLEKGTAVEIFDVMGRRIHHTTSTGQSMRIDVADMADGMYMILFVDKEGSFGTHSFIKE